MPESIHKRHRNSSERRRERKQANVTPPGLAEGWYKPLKEADLQRMHEASLMVLEQTYLKVMPSECCEIFQQAGPGLTKPKTAFSFRVGWWKMLWQLPPTK